MRFEGKKKESHVTQTCNGVAEAPNYLQNARKKKESYAENERNEKKKFKSAISGRIENKSHMPFMPYLKRGPIHLSAIEIDLQWHTPTGLRRID